MEFLYQHEEAFIKEFIQVSETHKVYFEVSGNPNGKNVLFLHGGPGSGCGSWSPGLFDPDQYKVILIDQRGSGKSEPNAEIKENTTQDLINDIEIIREKLNIKEWFLIYGGSWGSCLALAYSNWILSKEYSGNLTKIQNIVIHGIFLGRNSEIQSTYEAHGPAAQLFPDAFNDFMKPIENLFKKANWMNENQKNQSNVQLYNSIFMNENQIFSKDEIDFAVLCWSQWESRIASIVRTSGEWDSIEKSWISNPKKLNSHSIIENYYFSNLCWHDGNLFLQDCFAKKLANVKVIIVNGRFDLVCPASTAFELYNNLASNQVDTRIEITQAGHTILDPNNTKKIISIVNGELLE